MRFTTSLLQAIDMNVNQTKYGMAFGPLVEAFSTACATGSSIVTNSSWLYPCGMGFSTSDEDLFEASSCTAVLMIFEGNLVDCRHFCGPGPDLLHTCAAFCDSHSPDSHFLKDTLANARRSDQKAYICAGAQRQIHSHAPELGVRPVA